MSTTDMELDSSSGGTAGGAIGDRRKPIEDTEERVGIIMHDPSDRVLIVRGPTGKWSFPKGCLKRGEDAWAGMVREVREETGLDLDSLAASKRIQIHSMQVKLTHGLYWLATVKDPFVKQDLKKPDGVEVLEHDWVPVSEKTMDALTLNRDLRDYMRSLIDHLADEMKKLKKKREKERKEREELMRKQKLARQRQKLARQALNPAAPAWTPLVNALNTMRI
jgi:8-oxo-dGTP pyrophosphatase MutT (NUDIX family)